MQPELNCLNFLCLHLTPIGSTWPRFWVSQAYLGWKGCLNPCLCVSGAAQRLHCHQKLTSPQAHRTGSLSNPLVHPNQPGVLWTMVICQELKQIEWLGRTFSLKPVKALAAWGHPALREPRRRGPGSIAALHTPPCCPPQALQVRVPPHRFL